MWAMNAKLDFAGLLRSGSPLNCESLKGGDPELSQALKNGEICAAVPSWNGFGTCLGVPLPEIIISKYRGDIVPSIKDLAKLKPRFASAMASSSSAQLKLSALMYAVIERVIWASATVRMDRSATTRLLAHA